MTLTSKDRPNPYVGPRAFNNDETLYGRDQESKDLVDLLIAERIVLLYSPSGAGKTSLIQAKLISELQDEGFRVLPVMRPGLEPPPDAPDDANRYLLSVLLTLKDGLPPEQLTHLADADLAKLTLAEFLARLGPGPEESGNEVLIFDQFEEILTLDPTDEEAKEIFFAQVGEILKPKHRWALFSMREEYVAGLEPYLRAIPTRLNSTFRLKLLGQEAAQQAIQEPASQLKVTFTDTAAEQLITDLSTVYVQRLDGNPDKHAGLYVEPVQLQVVCQRLWEAHPGDVPEINENHLKTIGDVSKALADYYAEQVAAVAKENAMSERSIREWVQSNLITEHGFRGQTMQEPGQTQGLDNRAIRALVKAHLVREDKRGGRTWFELAHDRLIEPVRENNQSWFKAHLNTLQLQTKLWDLQNRPAGLLLTGRELTDAKHWATSHPNQMTDAETDFLNRCLKKRGRDRLFRGVAFGALIIGIGALVAGLFALHFMHKAREQARLSKAGQLASVAFAQLQMDPERSILLAREAVNEAKEPPHGFFSSLLRYWGSNEQMRQQTEYVMRVAENALHRAICTSRVKLTLTDPPHNTAHIAHKDKVFQVLYSPNGSLLATVSQDKTVKIWDAATGKIRHRLSHKQKVRWACFNRDGSQIATACNDKTAIIWDVASGKRIHTLPHDKKVFQVCFNKEGTCLATADIFEVKLWQAGTFKLMHSLNHKYLVDFAFSPDGKLLATAGYKGEIKIWDVSSGSEVHSMKHGYSLWKISFSPDGKRLVSISKDNVLNIWDVSTGKPLGERDIPDLGDAFAFSPDSKRLAVVSSKDYAVHILNVANNRFYLESVLSGHYNTVFKLVFLSQHESPGRFLATCSADGTAKLWDTFSSKELIALTGHHMPVEDIAVSPDEKRLATASWDGQVKVWDIKVGHTSFVNALAFNKSGARLATASSDGTARVWDTATGKEVLPPLRHGRNVNAVAFTPNWQKLVTAGSDGTVKFWRADNGKFLKSIDIEKRLKRPTEIINIAFSPHGKFMACLLGLSSFDKAIFLIWGHSKKVRYRWFDGTKGRDFRDFRCFAFSPDEKQMTVGLGDGRILVYDLDSESKPKELRAHHDLIFSVAYNPKKHLLATASLDRTIKLWDVKTWKNKEFKFEDWAECVTFSPDGELLAAGFSDRTARVFDLHGTARVFDLQKKVLHTFSHPAPILKVAFTPDGKDLATACYDNRWYLHPLELKEALAQARKKVTRELTPQERRRFGLLPFSESGSPHEKASKSGSADHG